MTATTRPRTQTPTIPRRRFASTRAIVALMLREMSTTNGRSPGGYLWAVLEPVAGIALLSLVFSVAFRTPALGISFPMFYATGMLPFLMFMAINNTVAQSLKFSRPLLAYPTVTFVDALIARFLLNAMTQLMVAYIVLAGIALLFETRTTPNYTVIVQAFALTALLGAGHRHAERLPVRTLSDPAAGLEHHHAADVHHVVHLLFVRDHSTALPRLAVVESDRASGRDDAAAGSMAPTTRPTCRFPI